MNEVAFTVNNLWMMIAAILVLVMHVGFATLESGLTQSKNTVNILFKNTMILPIGLLTYAFIGFNLMYPGDASIIPGLLGFAGIGLSLPEGGLTEAYNPGYTYWTDFIFQGMFAATSATIVSGAVAERIKLNAFLIFSVVFVAICYPIVGMWDWGGGFLEEKFGFYDFAGSTIVHSVGGWAALACIILLGPRKGKYTDGKIRPIPGHSMPLAVIGVFMLFFGWFGFNGGSVLSADPGLVSLVFVTTAIAAAAGAVGAFATSFFLFKKHDLTMALNGILGGLVGITAGADQMSVEGAMAIGFIAGVIIPFSVVFFDKLKLDDPVGATSVHLVCGVWGTLAVGIFGGVASMDQFISQVVGVACIGAFAFLFAFILMFLLKKTMGIRVDEHEESEGLDIHEHGMHAYPDFVSSK